jgi:tRNA-splicing ligase RtcB (3'-phosphate/5'-hydroxy nucleic acid ligase)
VKYFDSGFDFSLIIKSWCENPEQGALDQAYNLAKLPFAFKQICLMPDTHLGYGMPIGGVLATKGVIIPNAVGVDIGCGMCAVKTTIKYNEISTNDLKKVMGKIRKEVPVGFSHHQEEQDEGLMPALDEKDPRRDWSRKNMPIVIQEYENALTQIGTLGGGNHFIELQADENSNLWVMIHSGSRNFGLKIANHYNKLAKEINEKWFSSIPSKWDLAFLPIDSAEGICYQNEMKYCVDFAFANRKLMMHNILGAIRDTIDPGMTQNRYHFVDGAMINIAHNYAAIENHFGENVIVHRKGATAAYEGQIGIIPGSQGTSSYIVSGKGNEESFKSCSHGAGRKIGRKEAQRTLNLEDEKKKLDDQGIIHGIRNESDLDEASGAYKDIDVVMQEQSDLVDVVTKLKPLAVIKG